MPARNETAIAAVNGGHSAQHFGRDCGRIVLRHRVASRNPRTTISTLSFFDQPMNKEAVVAHNQHNLSSYNFIGRCGLNRQQIARPQRGKHARSPCLYSDDTVAAKQFGRKIKLEILARVRRAWLSVWHRWLQTTKYAG